MGTRDSASARGGRLGVGAGVLAGCFALALAASLVAGGRMLPGVLAGGLVNPDSYMRLIRLDEILSAGQVLDEVARDGSGHGTQLHWAHLVDSLLLLLAQALHLFLPWREALHAAAAAFGPLGVGALGAAAAWAAAPLASRGFLWLAPLAAALAPAVAGYGKPGVLHHHGALMLVATMLGGWALRGAMGAAPRGAGLAMGAWSALGIWFTPEAMPFILLAFGLVWIAWLEGPPGNPTRRMVREAGFGFLLAVALILTADPPRPDRWAALPDRISVMHLAMAAATALAAACTFWLDCLALSRWARQAVGCAVGAACIGGWIALFPGLLRGAEGLLDEATGALFFRGIAEMAPVRGLADFLAYLSGGVLGAGAVAVLAWRSGRVAALAGAAAAMALVAFSVQHVRFSSYPACLAAALLPVVLTRFSAALQGSGAALARVATIAAVLLLPQLGSILAQPAAAPDGAPGAACPVAAAVPLLLPHPGRVVLSDVNDVPEILYRTQVKTVGSLYHRSAGNYLRLRAAWRGLDPALLQAAQVELVLFCPRPRAGSLVHDLPGGTLYDALLSGQPPAWLVEIGRGQAGHVLYEVRR